MRDNKRETHPILDTVRALIQESPTNFIVSEDGNELYILIDDTVVSCIHETSSWFEVDEEDIDKAIEDAREMYIAHQVRKLDSDPDWH